MDGTNVGALEGAPASQESNLTLKEKLLASGIKRKSSELFAGVNLNLDKGTNATEKLQDGTERSIHLFCTQHANPNLKHIQADVSTPHLVGQIIRNEKFDPNYELTDADKESIYERTILMTHTRKGELYKLETFEEPDGTTKVQIVLDHRSLPIDQLTDKHKAQIELLFGIEI